MDLAEGLARICDVGDGVDTVAVRTKLCAYPSTYDQVGGVLRFAFENNLSVYPMGRGTNPVGPPVRAAVGLVLSRLNSVLEVSAENLYVSVQAGCPLETLRDKVDAAGAFLPVDYAGTAGGWASTNPVSGFSTWYGSARELLLGAKLYTGMGEAVRSGSKTPKFSSGYKVWKSLSGALGWLGVYVELYVRVFPKPEVFLSGQTDTGMANFLLRGGVRPVALWAEADKDGRETLHLVLAGFASALRRLGPPLDKINLSEGVTSPTRLEGNIVLVTCPRGTELDNMRHWMRVLRGERAVAYLGAGAVRLTVADLSLVEDARRTSATPVVVEKGNYAGDYWGYHPRTMEKLKEALDPRALLSPGKYCGPTPRA
jgi:FAD/FMN-containing dehydrogenase